MNSYISSIRFYFIFSLRLYLLIFTHLILLLPLNARATSPFSKGTLTDEEIKMRDSFVHEGHYQRTKDQLCKDAGSTEVCSGQSILIKNNLFPRKVQQVVQLHPLRHQ